MAANDKIPVTCRKCGKVTNTRIRGANSRCTGPPGGECGQTTYIRPDGTYGDPATDPPTPPPTKRRVPRVGYQKDDTPDRGSDAGTPPDGSGTRVRGPARSRRTPAVGDTGTATADNGEHDDDPGNGGGRRPGRPGRDSKPGDDPGGKGRLRLTGGTPYGQLFGF